MTTVLHVETSTGQQHEHDNDNNNKMTGQQETLPHNNEQVHSENIEYKQQTRQRVQDNHQL